MAGGAGVSIIPSVGTGGVGGESVYGLSLDQTIASIAGVQPILTANLATGQAWLRGRVMPSDSIPGFTSPRASAATAQTLDGRILSFLSGVAARVPGRGQLIQEARTNLCLQSQTFDNASWTKSNLTVTADAIAAPDGTTTADLLTVTTTAATNINQSVGAVTGTNCCASIYVQNNNRSDTSTSYILYDATAAANRVSCSVNWAAMTVSGTGASIERLGSTNWYRIILVDTAWTSGNVARFYAGAGGGSLTGGLAWYQWGAQVEAAASPSSYIPTTSSSATRLADAPVIDLLNPGLYDVSGQPELVTNGDFASNINGWAATSTNVSASWSAGKLRVACAANLASGHVANAAITTVVGRLYRFAFDFVTDAQTGNSFAFVGTSLGGNQNLAANIGSALGSYAFMFRATSTTTYLEFGTSTLSLLGDYFEIDNVSLKQVPDDQVIDYPCTIWVEFERAVDTGNTTEMLLILDDNSASNRLYCAVNVNDQFRYLSSSGGTTDGDANVSTPTVATGAVGRGAVAFAANNMRGAFAGTLGGLDSACAAPAAPPNKIRFGSNITGGNECCGYIRAFSIVPSRCPDAILQRLAP